MRPSVLAGLLGSAGFTSPNAYYFVGNRAHTPGGTISITGNNHSDTWIYLGQFNFAAHSFRMGFPGHTCTVLGAYPTETVNTADISIEGVAIGYSDTKDPATATWVDGSWTGTVTTANKAGLLSGDIVSSGSPIAAGKHIWARWTETSSSSTTRPSVYSFPQNASTLEGTRRAATTYSVTSSVSGVTQSAGYVAYGPSYVVCKGHAGRPVVLIWGDSIASNNNEQAAAYTDGVSGFVQRGLYGATKRLHAANFAVPGSAPHMWTHNTESGDYVVKAKLDLIALVTTANGGTPPFTHIISEHGTNSVNGIVANSTGSGGTPNGSTSATTTDNITGQRWDQAAGFKAGMQAYYGLLAAQFPSIPIWQTTLIPKGTTSDGWQTLVNQTPNTNTVNNGLAFNSSLRASSVTGVAGYIEVQYTVGDPSDRTRWIVDSFSTTLAGAYTGSSTSVSLNAAPVIGQGIVIDPSGTGSTVSTGGSWVDAVSGSGPYTITISGARSASSSSGTLVTGAYTRDGTHPNTSAHKLMAVPVASWAATITGAVA